MKAQYNPKFVEAMQFAYLQHAHQKRKGSKAPYVSHLLGVASLVIEVGGEDETAIAALLHDVIEDHDVAEAVLEEKFGPKVLWLVKAVTNPKVDWHAMPESDVVPTLRKYRKAYAERISVADEQVQMLSAADKLHNARCLLADMQRLTLQGTPSHDHVQAVKHAWSKFRGKKATETVWYYRMLAMTYQETGKQVGVKQLGVALAAVCLQLDEYNFDWSSEG